MTNWKEIDRDILSHLDIASEAELLGIRFSSDRVSADGWRACYSIDRNEQNPSAAVNVASQNGVRGRYTDSGSGQKSISFWDLAARAGRFSDWKEARTHYAGKAGVELSQKKQKNTKSDDLEAQVEFQRESPGSAVFLLQWTRTKTGVTVDAALRAGVRRGRWPARAPEHAQYDVLVFSAYSPGDWSKPTALLLYRDNGKCFPEGGGIKERKTHNVRDSKDGLILVGSQDELTNATVVYKCEGPTDALALAPHLPPGHIAVTNACGASSFRSELAEAFRGKDLVVVHDADRAGEGGATKVIAASVNIANLVRHVRLPYDVADNHGKDLRDFLNEHGPEAFLDLVKRTEPVKADNIAASANRQEPPTIRNFDEIEGEDEGSKIRVPLSMSEIITDVSKVTGDWPRRIDTALFIDDTDHGIGWFSETPQLFGWLKRRATVKWMTGCGFVTQTELFSELRRTSTKYIGAENLPHEPLLSGHYYTCPEYPPGDGSKLRELIARFNPETPIDADLIQAAFMTPGWGGPAGCRPCFVITSDDGRGVGKSSLASMIGLLWGGILQFSHNEDCNKIKTRLLSSDALTRRVALLDNVKSLKFSWAELEGMITASEVGGYRLYVGEATRPNTISWFITLNGANLSTDMAQRAVIIKIRKPDRKGTWEEDTRAFIETNRDALLSDITGALRGDVFELPRFSRWATWEKDVLQRLPEPAEAQRIIMDRQSKVDCEEEEAGLLEDYFREQLEHLHYDCQQDRVFIPSQLAATWFNACHHDSQRTPAVSRIIVQFITEGRLQRLTLNKAKTRGRGFVWAGEDCDPDRDTSLDIETRIADFAAEEQRQREQVRREIWRRS